MHLKKTIQNVSAVKVQNNVPYVCLKNGDLFSNTDCIQHNVEGQSFWIKQNWLYYHNQDGDYYTYNLSTKHTSQLPVGLYWFSIEKNQAFCSYDVDWSSRTWKSGVVDIERQALVKTFEQAANKTLVGESASLYLFVQNKTFYGLDKVSGSIVWTSTVDLSEVGRWYNSFDNKWVSGTIGHVVGVLDDVLWVTVSGHHLVGVDIRTGQIIYNLSYATKIFGQPTKDYHKQLPVTFRIEYDPLHNKLFGFIYDTYVEVILTASQPELNMYVLEDACSREQAFCAYGDRTCFDNQYFYYVDPMSGKVAAINRQDKTLAWVYSFPAESTMGALMQVQVADSKLYVLDSGGALHVFEMEKF